MYIIYCSLICAKCGAQWRRLERTQMQIIRTVAGLYDSMSSSLNFCHLASFNTLNLCPQIVLICACLAFLRQSLFFREQAAPFQDSANAHLHEMYPSTSLSSLFLGQDRSFASYHTGALHKSGCFSRTGLDPLTLCKSALTFLSPSCALFNYVATLDTSYMSASFCQFDLSPCSSSNISILSPVEILRKNIGQLGNANPPILEQTQLLRSICSFKSIGMAQGVFGIYNCRARTVVCYVVPTDCGCPWLLEVVTANSLHNTNDIWWQRAPNQTLWLETGKGDDLQNASKCILVQRR